VSVYDGVCRLNEWLRENVVKSRRSRHLALSHTKPGQNAWSDARNHPESTQGARMPRKEIQ
jgi:hypothetical protein